MSFLNKVKGALIQVEEDDNDIDLSKYDISGFNTGIEEEPAITAQVDINTEGVVSIDEIYEAVNLTDKEHSIYKVDEIRKVLPATIPNEAKKASVLGMMEVSKLSIDTVLEDANKRQESLKSVLNQFSIETNELILSYEEQIAEHEKAINDLKVLITNRSKAQEEQETIINNEHKTIENIVNFIK